MDKTQQFVEHSKSIFGDKYLYDKTKYIGSTQKVTITCKIHGDFCKTPNNHISSKQGCQKCSGKYKPSDNEFITKASKLHNNKFDYTNVKYVSSHTKVEIICPSHGPFFICPSDHIFQKQGCPKCGHLTKGSYHKKDTVWFLGEAQKIHGTKYDYSEVKYERFHTKVKIKCKEHGIFLQTPGSHITNKSGCPTCSIKNYVGGYGKKRFENHPELKIKSGILYIIKIFNETEEFIKVGITQKSVHKRFAHLAYGYNLIGTISGKMYDLFQLEQTTKHQFKQFKYKPNIKFDGHTECFQNQVLPDLSSFIGINR